MKRDVIILPSTWTSIYLSITACSSDKKKPASDGKSDFLREKFALWEVLKYQNLFEVPDITERKTCVCVCECVREEERWRKHVHQIEISGFLEEFGSIKENYLAHEPRLSKQESWRRGTLVPLWFSMGQVLSRTSVRRYLTLEVRRRADWRHHDGNESAENRGEDCGGCQWASVCCGTRLSALALCNNNKMNKIVKISSRNVKFMTNLPDFLKRITEY